MADVSLTLLLQSQTPEDKYGYHAAFAGMANAGELAGYRGFPYRSATTVEDWHLLFREVEEHMLASGSNAIFLQFFHVGGMPVDPRPFLRRIAALPSRPVIATSCGDGFGHVLSASPPSLPRAASVSDITFATSMGRLARALAKAGARRVTLMPHCASHAHLRDISHPPDEASRPFDVVFIGSRHCRNPRRHLYWAERHRVARVEALSLRYGRRFGLFGHGWSGNRSWQGPIEFNEQVAVTQRGIVAFGGYPASTCDYYTSDRPMIGALSEVPIVDHAVPLVDRLFERDVEWLLTDSLDDTLRTINGLLEADESTRGAIGRAGAAAVRARHSSAHRAKIIVAYLSELLDARQARREPRRLPLDFFHSHVDQQAEAPFAFHNW
jgi:hypothetical protein